MKKIITIVLLVVASLSVFSQGEKFTKVVQDSTLNKSQLLSNCSEWAAKNFKSKAVNLKDEQSGKIILDATLSAKPSAGMYHPIGITKCQIEFQCKDGKYKISFSNISYSSIDNKPLTSGRSANFSYDEAQEWSKSGFGNKFYATYINDIDNEVNSLITSLQKSLSQKSDF